MRSQIEKSNSTLKFWLTATVLAIFSLLLLLILLIYNEAKNEEELSGYFIDIARTQQRINDADSIRFNIIKSQDILLDYMVGSNNKFMREYFKIIEGTQYFLDTVYHNREFGEGNNDPIRAVQTRSNHDDVENLKEILESFSEGLLPCYDQYGLKKVGYFDRLEFRDLGVRTAMRTDKIVDSSKQKDLFRMGKAIKNYIDLQEKRTTNFITVEYFDDKSIGKLEEHFKNLLNRINDYYPERLRKVNNRYITMADRKGHLFDFNKEVKDISGRLLDQYKTALVNQENLLSEHYNQQYNKNRTKRFYVLLSIGLALIFLVANTVFLIAMIYRNQDKLIETRHLLFHNLSIKNKMVSMISHDIRAPLRVISVYAKQLMAIEKEPDKYKMFDSINYTASSAVLLADKILAFSKDEMVFQKIVNTEINLHSEINALLDAALSLAKNRSNRVINNNLVPKDFIINIDRQKLQRLYINLLDNAIKYTDKGTVKVVSNINEMVSGGYRFSLSVKDTGKGIDPDRLQNIFNPLTEHAIEKIKNTDMRVGLGLHICKEIVDLFNGEIDIKSQPNKGTEINLYLIV